MNKILKNSVLCPGEVATISWKRAFCSVFYLLVWTLSANPATPPGQAGPDIGSGGIAASDTSGYIRGTILLDSTWEQRIYMSRIETFEKKYTVSDDIIIESSKIDQSGTFELSLDKLPADWSLLRMHVIKRGAPPASLVIGSQDENYYFVIANRYSQITLRITPGKPVFGNVSVSGAPYMNTVEYITQLSNYPNSIDYEDSPVEKEFIEEVVAEKLRSIADSCENPIVSLFAVYQTDFQSDYEVNSSFYKTYLFRWKDYDSPYFESFQRQLPVSKQPVWPYVTVLIIFGAVISAVLFIKGKKRRRLRKLSVQERRVFELLQKGASNQEISDLYHIEVSTVKSHVSSIFSKLNIKSRKEVMNMK